MRPALLFAALLSFYVLLSGQFHNTFLMVGGVLCCAAVTTLSVRMGICDREGVPFETWVRTALYVPWLLWQIALSNWDVVKRIWRADMGLAPRVVRVPHDLKTAYGIVTYANSITLTPGTVTLEADESTLLVHGLTKGVADDLLVGRAMHDRVRKVEGGAK